MDRTEENELNCAMNELLMEKLTALRGGAFDYRYFKGLSTAKEIYKKIDRFGCDGLCRLCECLIEKGIIKTPFNFDEISVALTEGKQKAEFLLGLAEYGKGFVEMKFAE